MLNAMQFNYLHASCTMILHGCIFGDELTSFQPLPSGAFNLFLNLQPRKLVSLLGQKGRVEATGLNTIVNFILKPLKHVLYILYDYICLFEYLYIYIYIYDIWGDGSKIRVFRVYQRDRNIIVEYKMICSFLYCIVGEFILYCIIIYHCTLHVQHSPVYLGGPPKKSVHIPTDHAYRI